MSKVMDVQGDGRAGGRSGSWAKQAAARPDGQKSMSKTTITARIRADGKVVEVSEDGKETLFPSMPVRPMTESQVREAAMADPDARPMTDEDFQRAKRVPRVKTLRRALGFTQEEFAARYRIPLGTLRDWEQGRAEPDQLARAYLKVIAHDPERVHRMLNSSPN
jgi:putative transcriptional regulator